MGPTDCDVSALPHAARMASSPSLAVSVSIWAAARVSTPYSTPFMSGAPAASTGSMQGPMALVATALIDRGPTPDVASSSRVMTTRSPHQSSSGRCSAHPG